MFHGSRSPSCDPPIQEFYFTNSRDRNGNVSQYCLDVLHLKHNFIKKLDIPECIRIENLLNKIWYILTFPVPGRAPLPTSCSKSPLSFTYGKTQMKSTTSPSLCGFHHLETPSSPHKTWLLKSRLSWESWVWALKLWRSCGLFLSALPLCPELQDSAFALEAIGKQDVKRAMKGQSICKILDRLQFKKKKTTCFFQTVTLPSAHLAISSHC